MWCALSFVDAHYCVFTGVTLFAGPTVLMSIYFFICRIYFTGLHKKCTANHPHFWIIHKVLDQVQHSRKYRQTRGDQSIVCAVPNLPGSQRILYFGLFASFTYSSGVLDLIQIYGGLTGY